MNTPMKHSPLPWNEKEHSTYIRDSTDKPIFQIDHLQTHYCSFQESSENRKLVVHAVNNIERIEAENAQLRAVNEKLVEALKPFAAITPPVFGSTIPASQTWLWKPSQTSKDLPGVSSQNIIDAKSAFAAAKVKGDL